MKVQVRYVQQRGQSYFFRMAIPQPLQAHYENRSEISHALRSTSLMEAHTLALALATVYRKQFRDLKAGKLVCGIQAGEGYLDSLQLRAANELPLVEQVASSEQNAEKQMTLMEVYQEVRGLGKRSAVVEDERLAAVKLLVDWFGDRPIAEFMIWVRETVLALLQTGVPLEPMTTQQLLEMLEDHDLVELIPGLKEGEGIDDSRHLKKALRTTGRRFGDLFKNKDQISIEDMVIRKDTERVKRDDGKGYRNHSVYTFAKAEAA
ncbi:DUF6538 domain-containing protein [Tichowtungia aerotolerans]|uniref:DUF6538 domain-containing protein n=1 Tax=Tichowtungia aerotolerans TaxID=2697043 RepID=A0A6P1M5E6_9BACT|nr:DUF6538 domain-containing protein [Tichowtungia aerotolerans]QHI69272.1 hypothetical protein GT409_07355 [Tichowtungia aerotolerans]